MPKGPYHGFHSAGSTVTVAVLRSRDLDAVRALRDPREPRGPGLLLREADRARGLTPAGGPEVFWSNAPSKSFPEGLPHS